MKITEIAFTGYSVTNMKRAREFYEGVLGLQKTRHFGDEEETATWVEYDIGAGCLALVSSDPKAWPPHPAGTTAAFEVDDFDGFIAKLREAGVKFVWEPLESPMCWMAVVADPDGNWLVIHHRKPDAKP